MMSDSFSSVFEAISMLGEGIVATRLPGEIVVGLSMMRLSLVAVECRLTLVEGRQDFYHSCWAMSNHPRVVFRLLWLLSLATGGVSRVPRGGSSGFLLPLLRAWPTIDGCCFIIIGYR
ncbi:hypothetical protein NL676_000942 [Syzygium grande]|nr:hypothetical protein NL676_000942 [Syzygium grande]